MSSDPIHTNRAKRPFTVINSFLRWLRTAPGRALVQALVFALIFQGTPLTPLLRSLGLPVALPWLYAAVAVFGPEDFLRATGKPVTLTRTFAVLDPTGVFTLCIDNGGPHDQYGFVSSAVVTLNGREVATPSDFNQTVTAVTRPVIVGQDNELKVQLRSAPGSGFTL